MQFITITRKTIAVNNKSFTDYAKKYKILFNFNKMYTFSVNPLKKISLVLYSGIQPVNVI